MKKSTKLVIKKRPYCIVMHNRMARGMVKFEKDLNRLMRNYGFEFIGSGYDTTNGRRDIEWHLK